MPTIVSLTAPVAVGVKAYVVLKVVVLDELTVTPVPPPENGLVPAALLKEPG
ncbi:MAG TPA: hypothetical protein VGM42_15305 [Rhodopila sp.]